MPKNPEPQPGLLSIAPYVPGKSAAKSDNLSVKLSANESPLGASPLAIAAFQAAANNLSSYPDGGSTSLRETLAEVHGLQSERIVVGAGSDELLHFLAQCYLGQGDEAVMSEFGFLMYPIVTLGTGATVAVAKDLDYTVDIKAMLEAVTARTKIVWLANPNNPTGTYLTAKEVRQLHAVLPSDVILVIDNAYAEYVTADDFEDGAALVDEAENVVMVRTFSKVGLAAARVGWMYGPTQIVDAVNRLRGPFNVSAPAQAAGEAAARDSDFNNLLREHNAKWRDWLSAELASNALRVLPSQTNFALVLFDETLGLTANQGFEYLADSGIIVREMAGYGLPNALRISIGDEQAMRKTAQVLRQFLQNAPTKGDM
jgi:histidinol-phosphate aminotransferase